MIEFHVGDSRLTNSRAIWVSKEGTSYKTHNPGGRNDQFLYVTTSGDGETWFECPSDIPPVVKETGDSIIFLLTKFMKTRGERNFGLDYYLGNKISWFHERPIMVIRISESWRLFVVSYNYKILKCRI